MHHSQIYLFLSFKIIHISLKILFSKAKLTLIYLPATDFFKYIALQIHLIQIYVTIQLNKNDIKNSFSFKNACDKKMYKFNKIINTTQKLKINKK